MSQNKNEKIKMGLLLNVGTYITVNYHNFKTLNKLICATSSVNNYRIITEYYRISREYPFRYVIYRREVSINTLLTESNLQQCRLNWYFYFSAIEQIALLLYQNPECAENLSNQKYRFNTWNEIDGNYLNLREKLH